jgi:hypothetical protein
VVRLWTAAISGRLRFYVDDMERPLYEGEAEPFFRRPYDVFAEMRSINAERFRATVYQRDASYAPLPFAKRLRIVWTEIDEIHFYHIGIRRYPWARLSRPSGPMTFPGSARIDRACRYGDPVVPTSPAAKPSGVRGRTPSGKRNVFTLEGRAPSRASG